MKALIKDTPPEYNILRGQYGTAACGKAFVYKGKPHHTTLVYSYDGEKDKPTPEQYIAARMAEYEAKAQGFNTIVAKAEIADRLTTELKTCLAIFRHGEREVIDGLGGFTSVRITDITLDRIEQLILQCERLDK